MNNKVQGNENKIRLTAFFVLLTVVAYWLSGSIWLLVLLCFDFSVRSFNLPALSLFGNISQWIVNTYNLQKKPVYMPPKRFAARIGLAFSVTLLVLNYYGINSIIVSGILALFAALEAFIGFCAGCVVFNFLQKLKTQEQG